MIEILHGYRNDDGLRRSFNRLAEATFGLNFEPWYQNGFWTDAYDPYSVVVNGAVVANVSLNRMDLAVGGRVRRTYQLGTVMTDPAHRNRGYIRAILDRIEQDTADGEGVFLFANDEVLEFYPKFGFTRSREQVCVKEAAPAGPRTMEQVLMDCPAAWAQLRQAMDRSAFRGGCDLVNNPGLIFFYAAQFLQNCVFHDAGQDVWAIAEEEGSHLLLHQVYGPADTDLDRVIAAFGPEVRQVTLGFTPAKTAGFTVRALREEDCTFFVKGPFFDGFTGRIPSLGHA